MILLELFLSFFQIGLFSFGGGYAMIPLIQQELARHGWLTQSQFIDVIALAEMTPGPIAVNAATFVGYRAAGLLGGSVATLGVALPSLLLILLLSGFFFRSRNHPLQKAAFHFIRPTVTGLIASAVVSVSRTAFLTEQGSVAPWLAVVGDPMAAIDFRAVVLAVVFVFLLVRFHVHPVLLIGIAAVSGILLYMVLPGVVPALFP